MTAKPHWLTGDLPGGRATTALRRAGTAALLIQTDGSGFDISCLRELEPDVVWREGEEPSEPGTVVVHVINDDTAFLCTRSVREGLGLYLRLTGPPAAWAVATDSDCGPAADQAYDAIAG